MTASKVVLSETATGSREAGFTPAQRGGVWGVRRSTPQVNEEEKGK